VGAGKQVSSKPDGTSPNVRVVRVVRAAPRRGAIRSAHHSSLSEGGLDPLQLKVL